MEEIKTYEEAIKFLAEKDSNEIFLNKGADHAILVLKSIFDYSSKEILIFSGNNSGEVTDSDEYNQAVEDYLSKGNRLKIIIENKPVNNEFKFKVYRTIQKYNDLDSGKVQIRYATESFISNVKNFFDNEKYHFLVGDKKRFRLEVSPLSFKAICSFNHQFSSSLANFFESEFTTL